MAKVQGKGNDLAGHVTDGKTHVGYVKELRVMLMPDSGAWFAKSLDIDYEACGATLEEVKDNFAKGLVLTINEHLMMFGNLDKVLVAAPKQLQDEYAKLSPEGFERKTLSLITFLTEAVEDSQIEAPSTETVKSLQFDGIQFIQPKEHAIAA